MYSRHCISTDTKVHLYKSLILPSITYGLPAWLPESDGVLEPLFEIERHWGRIILQTPLHTSNKFIYDNPPFPSLRSSIDTIEARWNNTLVFVCFVMSPHTHANINVSINDECKFNPTLELL